MPSDERLGQGREPRLWRSMGSLMEGVEARQGLAGGLLSASSTAPDDESES